MLMRMNVSIWEIYEENGFYDTPESRIFVGEEDKCWEHIKPPRFDAHIIPARDSLKHSLLGQA